MIENLIETGIEIETEIESDHANPPANTTPSLPLLLAIRLRGVTKKLGELQRRLSGDGQIKYTIRGGCIRHPNIRWNMPGSPRGNKRLKPLPRLPGGISQQTPT